MEELKQDQSLQVVEGVSHTSDGNIWTSAGVFCGSKMALSFIKSFEGYLNSDGKKTQGHTQKVIDALQHDEIE